MRALPIRYVPDLAEAERLYLVLGFRVEARARSGVWVELRGSDGGGLALHEGASGFTENLAADEPLEQVAERLHAAGYRTDGIVDEAYGRCLQVRDPEGQQLSITEYDRELYT